MVSCMHLFRRDSAIRTPVLPARILADSTASSSRYYQRRFMGYLLERTVYPRGTQYLYGVAILHITLIFGGLCVHQRRCDNANQ